MSNHQIVVNFSENHETYYTAYKYVCKKDCNIIHSQNHPDLQEVSSPKTKTCIKAYKSHVENVEACRQVIYLHQKLKGCRILIFLNSSWLITTKNLFSANLQKPCKISSPQLGKWRKLPPISRDSKNTEWKSFVKPYRKSALKNALVTGTAVPLKSFNETMWSQLPLLRP